MPGISTIWTRRAVITGVAATAIGVPATARAQIDLGKLISGAVSLLKGLSLNEKDEIRLGEKLFPQLIVASGGLYPNEKVQSAIVTITQPLMQTTERREFAWQVAVVNNDTVNAWALPGGKIAINKGLLRYVDSEDELAAVIGHEMGHVELSHVIAEMRKKEFAKGLTKVARGALSKNGGKNRSGLIADTAVTELAGPIFDLVLRGYSKANEFEADSHMLKVLGVIGGDLGKAVKFFRTLLQLIPKGTKGTTSLFSTHPGTEDRIRQIVEASASMENSAGRESSDAFNLLKATFPTRHVYKRTT